MYLLALGSVGWHPFLFCEVAAATAPATRDLKYLRVSGLLLWEAELITYLFI